MSRIVKPGTHGWDRARPGDRPQGSERTRQVPAGTAGASHAQRGTWRGGLLVGRAASGVLETHHPEARRPALQMERFAGEVVPLLSQR